MIELFINGTLIEGLDDEIALTKAVNDLGELPTRQGEFSNTINIPMTKSNCLALGSIEDVNSLSTVINSLNSYELYDYGVLISTGYARVISLNDTIEINLFSGNADWSSLLKDKSVRDIDVSDLDYSIVPSEVASRRNNTSVMCCPNIWYGAYYDPARQNDSMDFLPAFFTDEIVKRMFDEISYTLINNLPTDKKALWDKIITIHTRNKWQYDLDGYDFYVTLAPQLTTITSSLAFFGGDRVLKMSNDITVVGGFQIALKEWSTLTPTIYSINLTTNRNILENIGGYVDVQIMSVTTPGILSFESESTLNVIGELNVTATGIYRVNFSSDAIFNAPVIAAQRFLARWGAPTDITYRILGGEIYNTNVNAKNAIQGYSLTQEYVTNLDGVLPEVKQSDLLVTLFNIFCIITTTDVYSREVTFNTLDTLIDNIPNAIDWTDKLDLSEEPEILFDFFDNYFQRNIFKYKDDDKDPRIAFTRFGEGVIDYNNNNLDSQGEVFESAFSATQRANERLIPIAAAECRLYGNLNWKLGVSKITTDNLITQFGLSAPTNSNEVFFDDLLFTNLINENYNTLKRVFANGRAIKLLVRLSRTDYQSIDFTTPIFIDIVTERHGNIRGHFYINEIEQYAVGKRDSTYVTLVKID